MVYFMDMALSESQTNMSTSENLKMDVGLVEVPASMPTEINTLESGKMISVMDRAPSKSQTKVSMLENGKMVPSWRRHLQICQQNGI
jgi:hypothetical protein